MYLTFIIHFVVYIRAISAEIALTKFNMVCMIHSTIWLIIISKLMK